MKKILSVLYIATLLFASCSDEYDDSALTGRVDNLENRWPNWKSSANR